MSNPAVENAFMKGVRTEGVDPERDEDELRHSISSALLARDVGFTMANLLGAGHELSTEGREWGDTLKDLWNNMYGSVIGAMNPNATDEEIIGILKHPSARGWPGLVGIPDKDSK